MTYGIHNFGPTDGDIVNYNNVPWGGVRTTRLRDPLNAPSGGRVRVRVRVRARARGWDGTTQLRDPLNVPIEVALLS